MKTRILKIINQNIRIVEKNKTFHVEHRPFGAECWQLLNQFSTIEKAITKKNNYILMIVLRDLGYQKKLIKRRTERKKI